jgi:hypothetical protein
MTMVQRAQDTGRGVTLTCDTCPNRNASEACDGCLVELLLVIDDAPMQLVDLGEDE